MATTRQPGRFAQRSKVHKSWRGFTTIVHPRASNPTLLLVTGLALCPRNPLATVDLVDLRVNDIFRATSVQDDGRQITVKARIRDNTVATNLEARRPGNSYGRNSETRITWPAGTSPVRIATVTSETTSSQSRSMTIVGNRVAENRSNHLEVSYEGRSPEDLTELAMRVALLGESNPFGTMSFLAAAENPLLAIANLRLPEDSFEQIARLLITEELVGQRGAGHITQFRLGPQHLEHRRLRLGWMPVRRYQNREPVEHVIEGDTSENPPA